MTERTRRLLDSYTDYLLVFFGQATATGLAALLPQARSSHPVPIGSSGAPAVYCTKQAKEIVGRLVKNIPEVLRMRAESDLIADIATRLEITEADVILCYKEVSRVYGKKVIYSDILKVVYKLLEVIKGTPTVADVVGTFRELPERQRQEADQLQFSERRRRKAQQLRGGNKARNDRSLAHAKRLEIERLAREVAAPKQQIFYGSVSPRDFDNPTHRRW